MLLVHKMVPVKIFEYISNYPVARKYTLPGKLCDFTPMWLSSTSHSAAFASTPYALSLHIAYKGVEFLVSEQNIAHVLIRHPSNIYFL